MKIIRYALLFMLVESFCSCDRFGGKENVTGNGFRIVSVSKHLTEMLFALGKGHNIVRRDVTSTGS